jgi:hypothetical protein
MTEEENVRRVFESHVGETAGSTQLPDEWPERAKREVRRLDNVVSRYQQALIKVAAPVRPDGTYNLGREACEQIAREALNG